MIILLLILAMILVVLALVIASQPSQFCIARSAVFSAPAALLFDEVNDLHRWEAWSPWASLDRTARNLYEGSTTGVGSVFRWEGNNKVGAGSMTIIDSHPCDLVRIRLDFLRPFKATHLATFTFEPQDAGTLVTWSMTGTNSFMAKAVVLVMNCDKMVGGMFEKGLASLKTVTEDMTVSR